MIFLKIAIIGPTYPIRGGISHYTTLLAEKLAEKNDVTVFSLENFYRSPLYKGKFVEDKSQQKIKCKKAKVDNSLSLNPLSWFLVGRKISKLKPDLVILKWWEIHLAPIYYVLLRSLKTKKILFICHNVLPHKRKVLDKFLAKLVLSKGNACIVHSRQDLKTLKSIVPNANAVLAFLPAYEIFQQEAKLSKEEAKQKLGLEGNIILFFGFVRQYKGLIYLIRAMPLILKGTDVTLLVVGEFWEGKGEYLKEIKQLKLTKNVKIVDKYVPNEEVALYFSAADALICPFTSATQSAVIQTAFTFNKPVIATNVGGLPEVVADGKTGFIVEPNNPKELAMSVIDFYKSHKEMQFRKNIYKCRKKFGWDEYIARLIG